MPCRSDYMEPTQLEITCSRALCVLTELRGESWKSAWWSGTHPDVYNKACSKSDADQWTANACKLMQALPPEELLKLSLEVQMWCRDHKKVDAARAREEARKKREDKLRASARAKLTLAERKAVGLE